MDIDKEIADLAAGVKKAPRKPRPSEIAAKLAKLAKKAAKVAKPKAKKKRKPNERKAILKSLRKQVKKIAKRKPAPKAKKASATKRTVGVIARPERLDMRLTKAERAKVVAVAKRKKRTITSIVYEAIAKMK